MNNQITYADKVALNQNSSIPDINKVNASDMNEIKSVVNGIINGSIPILSLAQYNSTNLATPIFNKVARTGNVVHIYFLAKINSIGSGNWDVLTNLPTNIFGINYRFYCYIVGDEYIANPTPTMAWTQVNGTSIRVFSGSLTTNKYIYIDLTYITND